MSVWLTCVWLGLFQAAATVEPVGSGGAPALVLVALPLNADAVMIEALHRLRGEATSVGFDVRLVSRSDEFLPGQLDGLWKQWHPAAVVTFARREGGDSGLRSLEVTFQERATGKVSVAQIAAPDEGDGEGRAEVIVAVRAVDFIRARMFDTLVGRRAEPPAPVVAPTSPSSPSSPSSPRAPTPRLSLAGGLVLLGTPSGYASSFLPRMSAGYAPKPWLRIALSAAGLGTRPERATGLGTVSLDQRLLTAEVTWTGPIWHRLQPLATVAGGGYWVIVRGDGDGGGVGQTVTLWSPAGLATLGFAVHLGTYVHCELTAGTLWLQNRVNVGTSAVGLGTLGFPSLFGLGSLVATF